MGFTDKLGQDVENFGNKMDEIARRIRIIGSAPIDLPTLVATDFIDCEVLVFHMNATGVHDLVERNPKALSEYEIIWTIKTIFRSLDYQVLWSHY